ncbi:MAG: ATP-binding protein [Sphingobacteriaceae bacterium]
MGTQVSPSDLHTLQLTSSLASMNTLENFIDRLRNQYELNEEIYANVLTCLNEACVNAILHGNKENEALKVYINLEVLDGKKLVFTVTDEGAGFDVETVPDPTTEDNREKPAGRGVYIIRKLADQCIFNNKGNQIELHFKI